ncbi:uncharacterized protein N7483_011799 [Penicillium malachiteum]|uniref:uncharacterized protein n=1 Tax=Penicillium malachiteum TaxID=1324776 RepID=UPI002546DF96|nr:uncharacterized protein N7483_011799 [Penicillium malachiteum]KAJ5714618.1 hypothetical protein N7483_011799 [Penicillium malachiteum]
MADRDMSDVAAEAAADFFNQVFGVFIEGGRRFGRNFYNSFIDVSVQRWAKVIASVVFYILIRPYIEKLFKAIHDRDRRKEKEKKEAERAARGKKAKMSANALRGGASGDGKVLGEVENTDDELEDGDENLAQASGVPEWNGMARKRQKKYLKNLQKQNGKHADDLTEEQIMELLDWSDEEGPKDKDA